MTLNIGSMGITKNKHTKTYALGSPMLLPQHQVKSSQKKHEILKVAQIWHIHARPTIISYLFMKANNVKVEMLLDTRISVITNILQFANF